MSKNLIIDGRTLRGVTALKATDADSGNLVSFPDTSDANATENDIQAGKSAYVNGIKINGTHTGVTANDLDGLVDGTIVSFIMPSGKTNIAQYRFYQFTSLVNANLGGVKTVGQYAFDGCTKFADSLPKTFTNIGQYAFRSLGASSGSTFTLETDSPCTLGSYAFASSKVSKVTGKYAAIGSYAFSGCTSLSEIAITQSSSVSDYAFNGDTAVAVFSLKVNGSVGSYAFYNLYNVADCNFDVESVITSLGNYAFSRFGSNRANPSENIITLDLRKSTFTSISQYGFGSDSSSAMYKNKYMRIFFPKTVTTINAYAFRYTDNCDFYFEKEVPPTLSVTTAWDNATNYKIFVPYNSVNAYRAATNWAAQTAYIKGYSSANAFEIGATLPIMNDEGYGLTWYSDPECTITVTTVTDATAQYYCVVGAEKLFYEIKSVAAVDCEVTITDGTNTYVNGDKVATGTILTITAVPTIVGYVPYLFKVNGADFTSGDTLTVDSDIIISAMYYDGQTLPINPVFAENSWSMIYQAFRAGTASQFWKVGDTKPVTLTDGKTYTIRIADMQTGRYALANGNGTTNGVLEFVECINMDNQTAFALNGTTKKGYWAGGGWALTDALNSRLPKLYNILPEDLQAAISEISLNEYSYSSPSPRVSKNKLFYPAETEIFANRHYSAEGSSDIYPKFTQYDFYKAITISDGNTCVARQKHIVNTTSSVWWWLRSPCSSNSNSFCAVNSNGTYGDNGAYSNGGVAPCFAI